jgi:hypothetical protein
MPLSVLGRPTLRRGYVQRRATSWRCQRKSVTGDTKKDDHAGLGSERLSAASSSRSAGRSRGLPTCRLRTERSKELEILVLRHQGRQVEQPCGAP